MSKEAIKKAWEVPGLTPAQRLVLLKLAYRSRKPKFHAWPSVKTIQRDTGLSRSTVQVALRQLEAKRLIRDIGMRVGYKNQVRVYQILQEPEIQAHGIEAPHKEAQGARNPDSQGPEIRAQNLESRTYKEKSRLQGRERIREIRELIQPWKTKEQV